MQIAWRLFTNALSAEKWFLANFVRVALSKGSHTSAAVLSV